MIKNKNFKNMSKVGAILGVAAIATSCSPMDDLSTSMYKTDYKYTNNYTTDSFATRDNITKSKMTNSMRTYDYTKDNAYDTITYDNYTKNNDKYNLGTNLSSSMAKTYNNADMGTTTKKGDITRTIDGVAPTKNTYTYDYSAKKDIAKYDNYMNNTKTYSYKDNTDLLYVAPSNYSTKSDYLTNNTISDGVEDVVYDVKYGVTNASNKSMKAINKVAKDVEKMTE